jgi:hypothetical protein
MAQKIEKIIIGVEKEQLIEVPFHSKILKVVSEKKVLDYIPSVYVLVNTDAVKTNRKIFMYKTGEVVDSGRELTYIDSITFGIEVYHVFEEKTP